MMKLEYIYEGDGDVFVDYLWERALSIDDEIYHEWGLEFFSTLYFHKDVDRTYLRKEKCIWFRLCGHEHILTLPEFPVILGLFIKDEVEQRLFKIYFGKLEVDDKQLIIRIIGLELEEMPKTRFVDDERFRGVAWSHYVTRFASFLGYCMDDEIKKCSVPIDYKYWTSRMLADELDEENTCLKKEARIPIQAVEGSTRQRQEHEGECEDEFEGRTTTLRVTLIMAIRGLWRATSPNL
nr:hypothetical protein [Tanacetum cinerariifolium]